MASYSGGAIDLNNSKLLNVAHPTTATDGATMNYVDTRIIDNFDNLSTTKGDLLVRDASALVRVPIGTDGQVFTADSAEVCGLKWADAPSGDHGDLSGLNDDDHLQYALLAGRAGGQHLIGGTSASDDLRLSANTTSSEPCIIVEGTDDVLIKAVNDIHLKIGGADKIKVWTDRTEFFNVPRPITNKGYDLGTSTYNWKDLYLGGYTEFADISSPANPGAGLGRLYKKTGDDGIWWKPDAAGPEVDLTAAGGGVTDHGSLTGLNDDDHPNYAYLPGRSGGQHLIGGTGASDDLRLSANTTSSEPCIIVEGTDDVLIKAVNDIHLKIGGADKIKIWTDRTEFFNVPRPITNGGYDLGTASYKWKDLYLTGNITVGGTVDGRDIAADAAHFTDTANPHSVTKSQIGLSEVPNLKQNLAASTAPASTDDSGSGYAVGSAWYDTTADKAYVCLDATATAAVWTEITSVGGGGSGDQPAVQVRRTTVFSMNTSFADVSFNATDIENDASIIEHNNTNTDNIDIKSSGKYLLSYSLQAPDNTDTSIQVRVNDSTVIPGSLHTTAPSSGDDQHMSATFIADLSASDYITLQAKCTGSGDILVGATFVVFKMTGAKGDTGPAGAGDVVGPGSSTNHAIARFDGTTGKIIQDSSQVTISDNGVLDINTSYTGYVMDIHNSLATGGGNGVRIMAGETLGDISLHIADADDTFQIMEIEADQGYITYGKTYAQTLTDNGVVYGQDNQHTGSATDYNTQNGIYRIGGNPVAYMTRNQNAVSASQSSTTSTTFQQKLRMTTPSVEAGDYRIGWYYNWRGTSGSQDFRGRVQIDDTTTIHEHQQAPEDTSSDQIYPVSGFYYATLTASAHNIDIDYCTQNAAATAYIWNARLEIWRV